ncbi:MAG: cation transporter [Betaproteobacteria bacterium]|nr:cation transporter [Betaproteobacteria bacterium]MBK7080143.1 cation transporter [Betaproteobacteria bacterium]MBK7591049.1 cation transporter [Betaproteobacteria bacterium]MBK7743191.1 cation transporter [Betaproteobacteria bacterium]MBK8687872.1 cation transporter [Betaproteobacteria bacterium]
MAWLSIATSLGTIALKFGAWFLTGSVSLWSDALEALVNLAAGLVALGAITLAHQPADDKHHYGHDKAEYFSSGVEGALILVAAVAIVWSASQRLLSPQPLENLGVGLFVAFLAGAMNFVTARTMLKVAQQHDSITLEADARHLLTDVWTSVGVVGGLLVVMAMPQWAILDPLMAVAVAIHILFTGFNLLRRSADGLMDTALPPEEVARAEALIAAELPAGASFHALRTRKAGSRRFLEFHLTVPGALTVAESHLLCDRIEAALEAALPRANVTIHVEPVESQEPHR